MRNKATGFTLIELLITVAIIAIVAAIAYPNYTSYVLRSHRNVAEGDLESAANAMERYYTQNNTYVGATAGNTAADIFPGTSPFGSGGTAYYTIAIPVQTANTYTLTATPIAASGQTNDSCGTLQLTSTGAKAPTTSGCW